VRRRNPFEFGRELSLDGLVDREEELAELRAVLVGGAKHFLIGPRRFGKTSLLAAASELVTREGAFVLRYNVEAFPSLQQLAAQLVSDVAAKLTGPVERVGRAVRSFFRRARPEISFDPADGSWTATLGVHDVRDQTPLLVDVLDGLERAAKQRDVPTGLILDEFQKIVEQGGATTEGQIRAAVQRHRHVAYVFAGSDTRLLAAMTGEATRPFYRLGTRRFVGPVPRPAFRAFLARGLRDVTTVTDTGVEAILDLATDVPYNVQLLAHACWEAARTAARPPALTPAFVGGVNVRVARRNDPLYSQTWTALTPAQQKALLAVLREGGAGLASTAVGRRLGLGVSTMQKALRALEDKHVVRRGAAAGRVRLCLEDPLFATWVNDTIPLPR
jgi:hypothetical protein